MKLVILQMSSSILYLTPVKMGRRPVFGALKSIPFPDELRGASLQSPAAFAAFVKKCIRNSGMPQNVVICVEDETLISKEYDHMPAKKKFAASFAKLEAESVLQESVENYVIRRYEYGYRDEKTGKLRASLFALQSSLAENLSRAFSRAGLRLIRIAPPIAGLLHAAKKSLAQAGHTVALISLDLTYTRLLIFSNGAPIFQRSFDSIFDEITELISSDLGTSLTEAGSVVLRNGMDNSQNGTTSATEDQIQTLLDASTGEVIRTIRMVLSSERLEMDKIVLSGPLAELPGFIDYCEELGLGVPLETVDACCAASGNLPVLDPAASSSRTKPGSYFMLNGLLTARKEDAVNFLADAQGGPARRISFTLVTAAVIFAMCLEPLVYLQARQLVDSDKATLNSSNYIQAQKLVALESQINQKKSSLTTDKALLPRGQGYLGDIYGQVILQIDQKALTIRSLQFNSATGSIAIIFDLESYDAYITLQSQIIENGYFLVSPEIVSRKNQDGTCTFNMTLVVNKFKPLVPPAA